MRSTIDFLILMGTDQRVVLRPTSHEDGVADLGLWLLLGRGDLQRIKLSTSVVRVLSPVGSSDLF